MRIRHLAITAFTVVAAAVLPAAGAAQAVAAPAPAVTAAGPTTSLPPTRPAKPGMAFTTTGTVTAVNAAARTVTLVTAGGFTAMAGATVTMTVATDAKILVGKVRVSLAQVRVGHRVTISGVRKGKIFIATSINARRASA
jgi:hypothetical protein